MFKKKFCAYGEHLWLLAQLLLLFQKMKKFQYPPNEMASSMCA